jgi:hypothetical protein
MIKGAPRIRCNGGRDKNIRKKKELLNRSIFARTGVANQGKNREIRCHEISAGAKPAARTMRRDVGFHQPWSLLVKPQIEAA